MLWRGIYATSTAYAYYDVIRVLGSGVWLVKIPHTTGAAEAFDPAKEIDGAPVYEALMVEPAPYVPLGPVIDSAITDDRCVLGWHLCSRDLWRRGRLGLCAGLRWHLSGRRRDSLPAGNGPGSGHLPRRHRRHAEWCCRLQPGLGRGEGAVVTLKYLGGNQWDVWGDLSTV